MNFIYRRVAWAALAPVALLIFAACGGDNDETSALASATPGTVIAPTVIAPQTTSESGVHTSAPTGLIISSASSDLSVGENRMVFALISAADGPIRDPNATVIVNTFRLTEEGGQEGPIETVNAQFRKWPTGPGGVYTTQLSFDRPGEWGLGIVINSEGETQAASTRIEVKDKSSSPDIGSPAPKSVSKTSADVGSLDELTTDSDPDPELYEMTIAEAIDSGRPSLILFSTPAFCQTATCGPQLDVVKELKEKYKDQANFIHIEVYDNPIELAETGNLDDGKISPTLTEWNLPSEPWTFIVDSAGIVSAKFEAFTTMEELEPALTNVLN